MTQQSGFGQPGFDRSRIAPRRFRPRFGGGSELASRLEDASAHFGDPRTSIVAGHVGEGAIGAFW